MATNKGVRPCLEKHSCVTDDLGLSLDSRGEEGSAGRLSQQHFTHNESDGLSWGNQLQPGGLDNRRGRNYRT